MYCPKYPVHNLQRHKGSVLFQKNPIIVIIEAVTPV